MWVFKTDDEVKIHVDGKQLIIEKSNKILGEESWDQKNRVKKGKRNA